MREDGRYRVLIVEDDESNRWVMHRCLQQAGFDAVAAGDALAALALLEEEHFHLVLMDLILPRMSGFAALREIRARGGRGQPSTPVLAVTAWLPPDIEGRCREAGFDGFLAKPFTLATLRDAVARALSLTPVRARTRR